jgi:hypothetical protein
VRKIPTLFVRDPADRRHVTREVAPGCEWVLAGEGVPTRKYDGTCVLVYLDRGHRDGPKRRVFVRREVKVGHPVPDGFWGGPIDHDPLTGNQVGWVPYESSGFARFIDEAMVGWDSVFAVDAGEARLAGHVGPTYELCGPKINGNPEGFARHTLVRHGVTRLDDCPRDFDGLRDWLAAHDFEGVVWHHPDGRMAKLKRRDFPRSQ